jgi:5-methylcytosine-specific restriction endonuclease McrA
MGELQPTFGEHTINELTLMFRSRQINLEPGFQRRSVWTLSDRRRLIQSIFAGYPLPSIFLYRRTHNGRLVYDVIDGKQRLESVFMFTALGRFKRDQYNVKFDLGTGLDWYDWSAVRKCFAERRAAFDSYKIQTVEVTGDLHQIIDLFVRINSTGKRLTSGERRHAQFYDSPFLREAEGLVKQFEKYLRAEHVLSSAQIDRMKGTELFSELLMSLHHGGAINKKTALDRAIGNDSVNGNTLHRLRREFVSTMHLIRRMFPNLRETRFHNSVEFYSLFLLVWEMEQEKFILRESRRNKIALELLRKLSTGVDVLREQLRHAVPAKANQRLYADYLLTVQGDTDSSATRERRRELLKGLLFSLFTRKDGQRLFSSEQRRILWNSDEKPVCARCAKPLSWEDFSVDHIIAYTRGGKTSLKNAQPMHRSCNSSKGAR